ncbi:hypothetical protein BP5796_11056 [Coleophoma crateriformis]|uniref:Zf-CHY-domain-containing protein n=1 Tax=Coleophoma crateriformis TaxID=565419 RepID=A0A3D8QMR6_9HELO|nr:hypothetical protein BP5796_11056 [Coleophoma crateriformis]
MTSLVSDFLINPILRQARRFSNSNSDHPESHAARTISRNDLLGRLENAIEEVSEGREALPSLSTGPSNAINSISGASIISSPIEEDGGLVAELATQRFEGASSAPATLNPAQNLTQSYPLRTASIRSEPGPIVDDITSNPSFGIPRPFRTSSVVSAGGGNQAMLEAGISLAEGPSRISTRDMSNPGSGCHRRNSSLPADDGMGDLRRQIIIIQSKDTSQEEKARMMHELLTQSYSESQMLSNVKAQPRGSSMANLISQERPTTPSSLSSFNFWPGNHLPDGSPSSQHYTFHLSPEDLQRTFAPPDESLEVEDGEEGNESQGEPILDLGCKHYKRNVKLQCSTCDGWYTCRLCHDEVEDHVLIRKATKNMLCMICLCAQKAGEFCVGCGERTAWYYCDVCKLWDNDSQKSIYHCNDCGICRKGRGLGKDFFHCKTCGVCMSMSVEQDHKCIERVSDCDCPICGEYMFTSPHPVVFMLCGHSIHQTCYYEHMKSSYKCPICSRSTVNMETQFRNLDRAIESQPMPPQFRDTKAMVSCNDCFAKSAVTYHWLGLRCAICLSYNTVQLSILSDPAVEVPAIESREVEALPSGDHATGEPARLGVGPIRQRRHSSHLHSSEASLGSTLRFTPYDTRQRIVRSVSPPRGRSLLIDDLSEAIGVMEDSGDDGDDLDFWGRDEPRSVGSAENIEVDLEDDDEEYEDDSDSDMDDCDEDEDDGKADRFDLFGHR